MACSTGELAKQTTPFLHNKISDKLEEVMFDGEYSLSILAYFCDGTRFCRKIDNTARADFFNRMIIIIWSGYFLFLPASFSLRHFILLSFDRTFIKQSMWSFTMLCPAVVAIILLDNVSGCYICQEKKLSCILSPPPPSFFLSYSCFNRLKVHVYLKLFQRRFWILFSH